MEKFALRSTGRTFWTLRVESAMKAFLSFLGEADAELEKLISLPRQKTIPRRLKNRLTIEKTLAELH
jgi:hypothetical protein